VKPTITESELKALDAALKDAADIDLQERTLADRKASNRAAIVSVVETLSIPDDLRNKVIPGISFQHRTTPRLDEQAVLEFALKPENFAHAAPLLKVRQDSVGMVISAAMQDDRLRAIFEVNMAGAQAAVRTGSHVGLPVGGIDEAVIVAVKAKDLQFGPALADKFDVVPDDAGADDAEESAEGMPF
jgi:hypothetical protein